MILKNIKNIIIILIVFISTAIVASYFWNRNQSIKNFSENLRMQAKISFEKDVTFRRWNAMMGGVYVPVTDKIVPNPYLTEISIKDRDLTTNSGKKLTLMNPAYMTRLVFELEMKETGIRSHITSINPIRKENSPDNWESESLVKFETGIKEVSSIKNIDGQPYFRYMRPLITEKSCLKCHAKQGYIEGMIRGGISVSVPVSSKLNEKKRYLLNLLFIHLLLILITSISIIFPFRNLIRSEKERARLVHELTRSNDLLNESQEVAKMGSYVYYIEKDYWTSSETLNSIFGISEYYKRDFSGYLEIVHSNHRKKMKNYVVKHVLKDKNEFDKEYKIVRKSDGKIRWVHGHGRVKYSSSGKPETMIGTIRDITDKKLREEEIIKLNSELEKTVAKRTAELNERIKELEKFFDVTIDRELEINKLRKQLSELNKTKKRDK